MTTTFKKVFSTIRKTGYLLLSDANLPDVASRIAGEPIKGSWWGHPSGNDIFNCSCELEDHPDIISVKLINGKVTFIHKDLWAALFSIAESGAPWQTAGLSKDALKIMKAVGTKGIIQTRDLKISDTKARSAAISELEKRLCVYSKQIHTESGKHERALMSWRDLRAERMPEVRLPPAEKAIGELESRVRKSAGTPSVRIKFPWKQ